MIINWFGQSCFKIQGEKSVVVTDPFDNSYGLKLPRLSADIVTISHDHHDHNNVKSVKGIGETVAESLASWLAARENQRLLARLEKEGLRLLFPEQKKASDLSLSGKRFVLTGELSSFTRDEAKAMIKKKGGEVSSSVSQKTDYVVAGKNPGSKYETAKKLGVTVLDEEAFKRLIEE